MVANKHYPRGFEDRINLADAVPLPSPLLIQCEPSSVCNLKCNYCIHGQPARKKQAGRLTMNYVTFVTLCSQIKEFGEPIKQFNFCGWGEPLINPYLPKMVKLAKDRQIARNIAVVTNGLLLTPKTFEKLVNSGLDSLRISLQGLTTDRYREVTGQNIDFESLINFIARLYKVRGNCELVVKFADVGITEKDEQLFHTTFDPITDRAYIEYIKPIFTPAEDTAVSRYGVEHDPTLICPQPFYMMDINAWGDVIPCCSYESPFIDTNILHTTLKKIWEGRQMKSLRLMQLSGRRKHQQSVPACKYCNIPGANIGPGDDLSGNAKEIKKRINKKE
jgi:GTP 3',8-cyclase